MLVIGRLRHGQKYATTGSSPVAWISWTIVLALGTGHWGAAPLPHLSSPQFPPTPYSRMLPILSHTEIMQPATPPPPRPNNGWLTNLNLLLGLLTL